MSCKSHTKLRGGWFCAERSCIAVDGKMVEVEISGSRFLNLRCATCVLISTTNDEVGRGGGIELLERIADKYGSTISPLVLVSRKHDHEVRNGQIKGWMVCWPLGEQRSCLCPLCGRGVLGLCEREDARSVLVLVCRNE